MVDHVYYLNGVFLGFGWSRVLNVESGDLLFQRRLEGGVAAFFISIVLRGPVEHLAVLSQHFLFLSKFLFYFENDRLLCCSLHQIVNLQWHIKQLI